MAVPKKFFYAYESYVRDRSRAGEILGDLLEEYFSRHKKENPEIIDLLSSFMKDQNMDSEFVRWLMQFGRGKMGVYSALLVGIAVDSGLNRQDSFRFFLCFWAASVFVNPVMIEK